MRPAEWGAFEDGDDFGQVLVVRVGDPSIELPLRLPEDAGEGFGVVSFVGGIWDQWGDGGERVEDAADVGGGEEERRSHPRSPRDSR